MQFFHAFLAFGMRKAFDDAGFLCAISEWKYLDLCILEKPQRKNNLPAITYLYFLSYCYVRVHSTTSSVSVEVPTYCPGTEREFLPSYEAPVSSIRVVLD